MQLHPRAAAGQLVIGIEYGSEQCQRWLAAG
jgi:hypothetical protein